ncbi:amylo-alpha-1,6-glucosidase [Oscillatoria sp. CS-180]|uniref:amylo-alpha-1,6-glucosidase n=1 Tax=Oscillatoria sp. CS-180 TaxID=3021720 RepID=UPI00232CF8A8|nr:amylo-alpha-1,6-glucosidase [Oscillatoria sp. CS-180]MDB9527231.1 amylo-alpha-1,6-glucosidase [Oscillatoria sp. CS-180]
MMLQFGRDICGHLAMAEEREWLVTNGIGGYACGTVAGLLTRHYHGLLVAALNPPLDRTLLLTKLDETVTYWSDRPKDVSWAGAEDSGKAVTEARIHSAEHQSIQGTLSAGSTNYGGHAYRLYCDRWADGTVTPSGYLQIERFALEGTVPTWFYVFDDALLVKRIWMEQGSNTTYIRYCLERASGPVTLSMKALLNHRNHHHSTRGQDWVMNIASVPTRSPADPQGITVSAFASATPFYVLSDRGTCTLHHQWYQNYDLAIERYRGIDSNDDHLHGATFEIDLSVGESVTIVATTEAPDSLQLTGAFERQQAHEQQLLSLWHSTISSTSQTPQWIKQLVLAADQFVVSRSVEGNNDGKTVIAGYPWFGDWGRDTMIALPGLAIATGRLDIARPILRTFAQYVDRGMLPNVFPEAGTLPHYNTVDATLWYFEAIRAYHAASQDDRLLEELFPVLADIIHWHLKGTRYNIHLDTDGLIYAGEPGVQLTWMDAKVGDWVVTPRIGKPVEINALWYNALLIMAQFADRLGLSGANYRDLADLTHEGFQRFWSNELGYCYDLLDGPTGNDESLRPNQILAVAFPSQPLSRLEKGESHSANRQLLEASQQTAVVETIARQLLTSHGLRSLDPRHPDYCDRYGGDPVQRDGAYHQGTVWGWLIGPFVQAHLRVYQDLGAASSFLEPFADHLRSGCIGTLSEIFDGETPFTPRGAYAQAWTVSEVLRAWSQLQTLSPSNRD